MDVRHSQFTAKRSEYGWHVVSCERDNLEWWADEIWAVESKCTPQGFTLFLTWLVDPQWDDHRRPGQAVWAVATCLRRPTDRLEAEGKPLLSLHHWPRGVAEFLAELSVLRDQHMAIQGH
jgi:hypothetical protein